jgi:solute carrier family 35 protein C2
MCAHTAPLSSSDDTTSNNNPHQNYPPADETTSLLLSARRSSGSSSSGNNNGSIDDANRASAGGEIGRCEDFRVSGEKSQKITSSFFFQSSSPTLLDESNDKKNEMEEEENYSQMKPPPSSSSSSSSSSRGGGGGGGDLMSVGGGKRLDSAALAIQRKFRAFKNKINSGRVDVGKEDDDDVMDDGNGGARSILTGKGGRVDDDGDNDDENGEKNVSTAYAQKIIERDTKWLYMKCFVLATLWFALSASLALYNKAVFSKKGFPAPLLYTSCQFFMQWLLATAALQWPQLFNDEDKRFVTRGRPIIPTDSWSRTILPVGFFMGLDIGLSNISLVYITVSFYTLTKTTSLIFTLFVSFVTGMEKFSWTLTGIVVTVMLGEAAAVIGETQFNAIGFFICLSAAAVSAVRWVIAQKVMHSSSSNKYGLHHPVILLYHAMPVMTVVTFSFSCVHEQWWEAEKWDSKQWSFKTSNEWIMAFATVLFGACMAFGMTLSEFELLKTTSAITVMIIGTAKDLITIGASVVIYGDVLDAYNVCGLFLCLMGIIGYNNYKLQKMKKEALTGKTGDLDDGLPLPVVVSKSNYKEDDEYEDDIFHQTFVR